MQTPQPVPFSMSKIVKLLLNHLCARSVVMTQFLISYYVTKTITIMFYGTKENDGARLVL